MSACGVRQPASKRRRGGPDKVQEPVSIFARSWEGLARALQRGSPARAHLILLGQGSVRSGKHIAGIQLALTVRRIPPLPLPTLCHPHRAVRSPPSSPARLTVHRRGSFPASQLYLAGPAVRHAEEVSAESTWSREQLCEVRGAHVPVLRACTRAVPLVLVFLFSCPPPPPPPSPFAPCYCPVCGTWNLGIHPPTHHHNQQCMIRAAWRSSGRRSRWCA